MRFSVGMAVYQVRRQYGLELDGQTVEGYIDHDAEMIYVDGMIDEPTQFERILRHEHVHAWEWVAGAMRQDGEDRAQFITMCAETFNRDYLLAGGRKAFLALKVHGTRPAIREPKRIPALSNAFQAQRCCGMCGQSIAAGSIANSDPVPLGGESYIMDRYLRCPMCDSVTCWRETCSEIGTPTGGIVNAKVLAGQDAARWLEKNPAPPCEWNVA